MQYNDNHPKQIFRVNMKLHFKTLEKITLLYKPSPIVIIFIIYKEVHFLVQFLLVSHTVKIIIFV